jgi:hypothetical protein
MPQSLRLRPNLAPGVEVLSKELAEVRQEPNARIGAGGYGLGPPDQLNL